jgi:hypothetical protein
LVKSAKALGAGGYLARLNKSKEEKNRYKVGRKSFREDDFGVARISF